MARHPTIDLVPSVANWCGLLRLQISNCFTIELLKVYKFFEKLQCVIICDKTYFANKWYLILPTRGITMKEVHANGTYKTHRDGTQINWLWNGIYKLSYLVHFICVKIPVRMFNNGGNYIAGHEPCFFSRMSFATIKAIPLNKSPIFATKLIFFFSINRSLVTTS